MKIPFTVSPSDSNIILHAKEHGNDSYVELTGWFKKRDTYKRIKITFNRFLGGRMYSMGGEAKPGIGFHSNSSWLRELNEEQKRHYPEYPDNFKDVKHYYFQGHDVTFEILAEGLSWESIGDINW